MPSVKAHGPVSGGSASFWKNPKLTAKYSAKFRDKILYALPASTQSAAEKSAFNQKKAFLNESVQALFSVCQQCAKNDVPFREVPPTENMARLLVVGVIKSGDEKKFPALFEGADKAVVKEASRTIKQAKVDELVDCVNGSQSGRLQTVVNELANQVLAKARTFGEDSVTATWTNVVQDVLAPSVEAVKNQAKVALRVLGPQKAAKLALTYEGDNKQEFVKKLANLEKFDHVKMDKVIRKSSQYKDERNALLNTIVKVLQRHAFINSSDIRQIKKMMK